MRTSAIPLMPGLSILPRDSGVRVSALRTTLAPRSRETESPIDYETQPLTAQSAHVFMVCFE